MPDVRNRMSPPHRQSVAQISAELGIHVITLYKRRKAWHLQGPAVPVSQKDPVGWGLADKFTVVLESAGLNAMELGGYCLERGLFHEQVDRGRRYLRARQTSATVWAWVRSCSAVRILRMICSGVWYLRFMGLLLAKSRRRGSSHKVWSGF